MWLTYAAASQDIYRKGATGIIQKTAPAGRFHLPGRGQSYIVVLRFRARIRRFQTAVSAVTKADPVGIQYPSVACYRNLFRSARTTAVALVCDRTSALAGRICTAGLLPAVPCRAARLTGFLVTAAIRAAPGLCSGRVTGSRRRLRQCQIVRQLTCKILPVAPTANGACYSGISRGTAGRRNHRFLILVSQRSA